MPDICGSWDDQAKLEEMLNHNTHAPTNSQSFPRFPDTLHQVDHSIAAKECKRNNHPPSSSSSSTGSVVPHFWFTTCFSFSFCLVELSCYYQFSWLFFFQVRLLCTRGGAAAGEPRGVAHLCHAQIAGSRRHLQVATLVPRHDSKDQKMMQDVHLLFR